MLRIRIQLPTRQTQSYSHYDLIHDALINAWLKTGASAEHVIGHKAALWNFAALGHHQNNRGFVHSLIVSTSDAELALSLSKMQAEHIQKTRQHSQEKISFANAKISLEADPIPPHEGIMSLLMLSPLAIRNKTHAKKHWYSNLNDVALSDAINYRLSKLAQRPIDLMAQVDMLYLRANPKHSVYVNLKHYANGQRDFVIGMQAPLILAGCEADLRFAWYTGLGEKTRNGFGCIGLLENGVGR